MGLWITENKPNKMRAKMPKNAFFMSNDGDYIPVYKLSFTEKSKYDSDFCVNSQMLAKDEELKSIRKLVSELVLKHTAEPEVGLLNIQINGIREFSSASMPTRNLRTEPAMYLTLPIIPAFVDIFYKDDLKLLHSSSIPREFESDFSGYMSPNIEKLIEERVDDYMNCILHELARTYVACKDQGYTHDIAQTWGDIYKKIEKIPDLQAFDLSEYDRGGSKFSNTPYSTYDRAVSDNNIYLRERYRNLQENIPQNERTPEFYKMVRDRDERYIEFDNMMNELLVSLRETYKFPEDTSYSTNPTSVHNSGAITKVENQPGT